MAQLWDPERLATAGWIMNRYAEYLREGDLVRIGQEGDPCSTYRSSDDAPGARVDHIEREVDGTVRFRAVLEGGSGVTLQLDNRNVSPDRIWEIHPSQVEEFRGRVQREQTHRGATEYDDDEHDDRREADDEKRDEIDLYSFGETHDIHQRIRDIEYRGSETEKMIGGAIRELAGDLMRMHRGEAPTFSIKFADKYDLALHTNGMANDVDVPSYQGARTRNHNDRHTFSAPDTESTATAENAHDDRHSFVDEYDFPSVASYTDDVRAAYTPEEE